jgi:DUF1016 N-terminal domain
LADEFGSGWSRFNVARMVQFAERFPDAQIVATLSQQLGWSHFKEIIPFKDSLLRDFYAEMCRINGWPVRLLRERIDSLLYERTAICKKPDKIIRAELDALRKEDRIIATSFPTQAVRLLLEKLPPDLPHWHFGDTDPAGYFILAKLREICPRPFTPWQMDWSDQPDSPPLTGYDRHVLNRLLAAANMEDVRPDLYRILENGRKGWFEQETRPALLVPSGCPASG